MAEVSAAKPAPRPAVLVAFTGIKLKTEGGNLRRRFVLLLPSLLQDVVRLLLITFEEELFEEALFGFLFS
ncbi:hypothetical protein TYRP_007169 [Tyrophagus putrescentiae]|nr:hypothetical protein TYRP_007169 [Tyrophagus putrescentiae]